MQIKKSKVAINANKTLMECANCKSLLSSNSFPFTKSPFYANSRFPFCGNCIEDFLRENNYNWNAVDKLCQVIDIPFIPEEWQKMRELKIENPFLRYADSFSSSDYYDIDWKTYNDHYLELEAKKLLGEELPLIQEEKRGELLRKWGSNYDDEALNYLESLYNGLLTTQNVNGALQGDQAIKLCKISYEIDCRIREGSDFDKILASYEKLVKAAEFTPRNAKNINDFDTVGELIRWLEKRGWKNPYYDNVTRDIVDETMKNIQAFTRRLYVNESGIGDEITRRIGALDRNIGAEENYYGTDVEHDLDNFENEGYEQLVSMDEEFLADNEEE